MMKEWVLELGLYNTTLWAAVAGLLIALFRGRLPDSRSGVWKPIAILLVAGSVFNLALGFVRGYVSPRDFLQDVVSAKEYLAGRSMYPSGMNERFGELIAEERRYRDISLGESADSLKDKSVGNTVQQHWVQAHPPFTTLFYAVMVRPLGVIGTQIAIASLSLLCLIAVCTILARELGREWGRWKTVAVVAAGCGAAPIVTSLRLGQLDSILLALVVFTWFSLRRGRCIGSGVALGLAVSLKLIPGLLLPVLLVRWHRAFLTAVVVLFSTAALVTVNARTETFLEYRSTASDVAEEYAGYPSNLSALGFFTRSTRELGYGPGVARRLWFGLGCFLGLTLLVLSWKWTSDLHDADVLLATGTALMPLLSPVAWDHYLTFLLLPLAVAAARGFPFVPFTIMLFFLTVPETAYLTVIRDCRSAGWQGFATFVVEPVRTFVIALLASWLGLQAMKRSPGVEVPAT